jgi:hypothetical protein
MAPSGLALRSLRLAGIPKRAQDVLKLRGIEVATDADGPALTATFATPRGPVVLTSAD